MIGRLLALGGIEDDRWWGPGAGFSQPTVAGPSVDTQEAMTLPALFCAMNTLSGHMAMLPIPVLKQTRPDHWERDTDHPAYDLLNVEANDDTSAFKFRQSQFLQTMLYGNSVSTIDRLGGGDPFGLNLVFPDRVRIKRDTAKKLTYLIRRDDGGEDTWQARDVLHTSGLGMNGITGYGLIRELARENVGLGLAIAQYAQTYFGNGTVMGTIVSYPEPMTNEAFLDRQKNLEAAYSGKRMFKTLVTDGGAKIERMSVDPKASQTIELATFAVQDAARWTGVPPPLLMELSRATFSNISELGLWYVKFTLTAWFKSLEQEFARKLIHRDERKTYRLKYIAEGLLRGDVKTRSAHYALMLRMGVFTINDVLALEDMNGIGADGDKRFIDMNRRDITEEPPEPKPNRPQRESVPEKESADSKLSLQDVLDLAGPVKVPPEPEPEPTNDFAQLRGEIAEANVVALADAIGRMVKVQRTAVARAAKKDGFAEWVDEYYNKHSIVFRVAISPAMDAMAGSVRPTIRADIPDAEWDEFVGEWTKGVTTQSIDIMRQQVSSQGLVAFDGLDVESSASSFAADFAIHATRFERN